MAATVIILACLGPLMAPHPATALATTPFQSAGPDAWLGADTLGRDVLSRVLDGGWQLLLLSAAATATGVGAGAVAGITAAFLGGWREAVLMRISDAILAFPQLVFVLLLVSVAGPKPWLIALAVALTHVPQVARVMYAATLDVSERDFVKSCELLAMPAWRTIVREILPNVTAQLLVEVGLRLTYSITIIAGLSFLGFGLQPPMANWGLMIQENRVGLTANPLGVIVPSLCLALLTIGVNTFVDALSRSLATPRSRRNERRTGTGTRRKESQ